MIKLGLQAIFSTEHLVLVFLYFCDSGDPIPDSYAIGIFKRVSKFWSLGTVLGVPYDKMDRIEDLPHEQQAIQVANICIKMDFCSSYEKLYHALRSPSVNDQTAAKLVEECCSDVSIASTNPCDSKVITKGWYSKSEKAG